MAGRDKEKVAARTEWKAVVGRLSGQPILFEQDPKRRRKSDRTTYVGRLDDGDVTETVEVVVMSDPLETGVITVTDEEFGDYMITFDVVSRGIRMSVNSAVHQPPMTVIPAEGAAVFEQLAYSAAEAAGEPFEFIAQTGSPALR